jgi:hypothetical protein
MRLAFGALGAAVLAYEALALANRQTGDTISERVWRASEYPLVPFAAGLVCGHFFWQRSGR